MAQKFSSKIIQKMFDTKLCFWDSSHTHRYKTHSHMRTKTLLLTAALAAVGVSSSMAQVYSVNAVGYVNLSIPKGFSMIANQFTAPSYKVSDLIPNPAAGSTLYKFSNPGGYTLDTFDEFNLAWDNPD